MESSLRFEGLRWHVRSFAKELLANKHRALLSVSGVSLSVIVMITSLAVLNGVLAAWDEFIEQSGGLERMTVVRSAAPRRGRTSRGISEQDSERLRSEMGNAFICSPTLNLGQASMTAEGKEYNGRVIGVKPEYLTILRYRKAAGRFLNNVDSAQCERVIVLGDQARRELFGNSGQVVGRIVTLRGIPFLVVGLTASENYITEATFTKGADSSQAPLKNLYSYIPLESAQTFFPSFQKISSIELSVRPGFDVAIMKARITQALLNYHDGVQDFAVESRGDELAHWQALKRSANVAIALITVVTFIVGGIGILNIMLASLHERVREIGVRRALGASQRDIRIQFLLEAVFLAALGGSLGVCAAVAIVPALGSVLPSEIPGKPVLVLWSIWAALLSSILVGILSGLVPAAKAANMDPLEALRNE
jgi:putative ABC transport system permease protein